VGPGSLDTPDRCLLPTLAEMRMRFKRSLLGLSLVGVALVLGSACSEQAEGERCSKDNRDSDCAAGLTCRLLSALGRTGDTAKAGVCCPISGPATTEACTAQQSAIPDGPTTTRDAGTGTGSRPEASIPTDATPLTHD
jgi:hypothetical protein